MTNFDVAVIGGGISGLSTALILSSGIQNNPDLADRKVCVIDAGGSDALKARFFNAPGIKQGISGKKALNKLREQVQSYAIAKFYDNRVKKITRVESGFQIEQRKDDPIMADNIVLATGFRAWDIKGLELPLKPFTRTTKPSRVAMEHSGYKVADNIYVCGLLADVSSQYPIVAGTGAQVALDILHDWTGEWVVIHDKI
jgi:thioredoxin reductase